MITKVDVYAGGGFTMSGDEAKKRGIVPGSKCSFTLRCGGIMSDHANVIPEFLPDGSVRFEMTRATVVRTVKVVNGGGLPGVLRDEHDQVVKMAVH